jgi:hypothetical protein
MEDNNNLGPEPEKEEVVGEEINHSPVPEAVNVAVPLDFYAAIAVIVGGGKVTKADWGSKEYYGVMESSTLRLHKPDGKSYNWLISEGDILGTDYEVIS